MNRLYNDEERIKRAQIVAEMRNNGRISVSSINNNTNKRKMPLLTKTFIQVIISICIFGIMYFLNHNNSIAIESVKPIISSDTDFVQMYNEISSVFINNKEEKITEDFIENSTIENEMISDDIEKVNEVSEQIDNEKDEVQEIGIGGGSDNTQESEEDSDVTFIKQNASFIKPVEGIITSPYGKREPTDIISENHQGVDLGANTGTDIIASMEGIVELVSEYGDYGKHIKISNGEISTLYAHCSEIVVNEGEYINQGQKIAEVGATGKATGPHLHFEIRRNNITVDPQDILEL